MRLPNLLLISVSLVFSAEASAASTAGQPLDIHSALAAGLVGGRDVAPSANPGGKTATTQMGDLVCQALA